MQLDSDLNQDKQLDPDTQTLNGIHSLIKKKHSYRKIAKKMQWCIDRTDEHFGLSLYNTYCIQNPNMEQLPQPSIGTIPMSHHHIVHLTSDTMVYQGTPCSRIS